MSSANDGGPAFPSEAKVWSNDSVAFEPTHAHGMSLRDYFAGQALVGYLSGDPEQYLDEHMALRCYARADAMLRAREAKP